MISHKFRNHFIKFINSNYFVSVKILHLIAKLVKDPKNAKHNEGKQLSLIFFKSPAPRSSTSCRNEKLEIKTFLISLLETFPNNKTE